MAGRNQKFSLNPEINFFGDGRFITDAVHVRKRSKADKYDTAKKVWAEAFPGRAWPHWAKRMKPVETGRAVRTINSDSLVTELVKAEDVLYEALISRSTDPAELIKAIGHCLRHIRDAKWASNEIERICANGAKRGTYKKVKKGSNGDE